MKRNTKRAIIITIYVSTILFLISALVLVILPEPSCFDGIKNQNEIGIDCGGACAPCAEVAVGKNIIVQEAHVLYGGESQYDIVASIHNPNALYGGEKVYYTIDMLDSTSNVITSRSGETYILPNENKYIIEVGFESSQKPSKARVSINNVEWVKFTTFDSPQILVKNQRFGLLESGTNYAEAFGLVSNESPYDFHDVIVNVVLKDDRGMPIAINKTVVSSLDSDEVREFRLIWPHKFPGNIKSADMQAETDVFDSQNFMKKYLPGGKHQELN